MKPSTTSHQPLATLIVLCYQQEDFVEESILSMFEQDYRPLQVIICDDCSTDGTVAKIESLLPRAPSDIDVKFVKNKVNLGLSGNINSGFDVSSGDYVFMAAGDDISVPNRISRCMEAWSAAGYKHDLICTQFEDMDENSKPTGIVGGSFFFPDEKLPVHKWRCGATGACAAYSRRVFTEFGPIDTDVRSEDWVLSFRAWLLGGGLLIEEPLVKHRTHSSSISVQTRSISDLPSREKRRLAREKVAIGSAGIAREWSQAWKVMSRDEVIGRKLDRQREVAEMIVHSYQQTKLKLLGNTVKLAAAGHGRVALRLFARNIFGMH